LRCTAPQSHLRNDLWLTMGAFVTPRLNPFDIEGGEPALGDAALRVEMMVALLLPVSAGALRLTSTHPGVQPDLNYNYLADSFDRQRLRDGVRLCLRLAQHEGLRRVVGERLEPTDADLTSDASLDDWLLREATTFSHISGTCKMGPASDPMAVVDQYGRVHGLEGLRVADASMMPDLVRAPINPTVIMMAERLADLVQQGH
jgi:choline dehydrogenase